MNITIELSVFLGVVGWGAVQLRGYALSDEFFGWVLEPCILDHQVVFEDSLGPQDSLPG